MADHTKVAERAYHLYLERMANGIEGTAEGDWEAAERDLSAEPEPEPASPTITNATTQNAATRKGQVESP